MTQVVQPDHLHSVARALLGKPDDERVAAICRLAYIPYPKAEEVLSLTERLFSQPTPSRPRGFLLSALSGNGKSTIVRVFVHRHPVRHTAEAEIIPVLPVEAPPAPNVKMFLGQILRSLEPFLRVDNPPVTCGKASLHQTLKDVGRLNFLDGGDTETRLARVTKLLKHCGVSLIFVDEVHNLLAGTGRQTEESCNLVKFVSNQLGIRIVLVGTERAENVVRSDPQLLSRFPIVTLPLWKDGKTYRRFLNTIESQIPLAHPSNLAGDEKASFLLRQSQGVLGDIVIAIKDGAILAIQDGSERITMDHLKHSVFSTQQVSLRPEPNTM